MAPPLRTQEDVEALIEGLKNGVIDAIATDHAPHGIVDKDVEFDQAANGIIGLQTALPVTLKLVTEGRLSPSRWIESLSLAPARILNLPYGNLKRGAAADIVVFDSKNEWVLSSRDIESKSKNSPYLNQRMRGRALATLVEGAIAYEARNSRS
jgi:dihydroorotase